MRSFFDTNVLVYMFDQGERGKQRRAMQLFEDAIGQGRALLSTQVLQEFFVVVTRRLSPPMPYELAGRVIRAFTALPIVQVDPDIIVNAIELTRRYRFSFWDGLIIEAALRGGAKTLYTEDLQHGQVIETLQVENPFLS
ncbi:MAG: PIN domain-containing protein [Deltaproteobacteria bacterium]|nr:PIN domain-containing protein [Deltaproteobacteria bacterium]